MSDDTLPNASVSARAPGRYILTIKREGSEPPFLPLSVRQGERSTRRFAVPALGYTTYVLTVDAAPVNLFVGADSGARLTLRRAGARDFMLLLRMRGGRRVRIPFGEGAVLTPLLGVTTEDRGVLRGALHLLAAWGLSLDTPRMHRPGLLIGKDASAPAVGPWRPSAPERPGLRTGVVLHLYYRDLWPTFERALRRMTRPFGLVITITEPDAAFEANVRSAFPDAEIDVCENRGRDVGPFLELLKTGRLDRFDVICKLHGKRSGDAGARALLGDVWRELNIQDLLNDARQVEAILDMFANDPDVGMIGSAPFRLPNAFLGRSQAWGTNEDQTHALAQRMDLPDAGKPDFFAGTMFWTRRQALEPLAALNLGLDDFSPERPAADGELQHAIERLFAVSCRAAGLRLAAAPDPEF